MEIRPRTRLILAGILFTGLVLRATVAATAPLLDGETYYWVWSKTPALSYLDQPPFIAYLIRLTTALGDGKVWVRLGPLLAGVLTPLALFTLGREMFGVRAGLIAAALFQLVPLLAGAGVLALPETPLFLWWSLALVCVHRALWKDARWWIPAGVAIGLGMLSKIAMITLPLGILGFVLARRREALRQPWPYVGAALALALFAPVLLWNAGNGWAMVRFVLHGRPSPLPAGPAGLLAAGVQQLAYALALAPVLFWAISPLVRRRRDDQAAFLLWMSAPALVLVATVVLLWGGLHGYWAGPAYLSLSLAVGAFWPGRPAALAMGVNAALTVYAALLPLVPVLPAPPGMMESVAGWRRVAARAEALAAQLPEPVIFVVDYFEGAAQLAYHTGRRRPVTIPRPFPGSVWAAPSAHPGASAVWLLDAQWRMTARPEEFYVRAIEQGPLVIVERGRVVRRVRIWTATGPR